MATVPTFDSFFETATGNARFPFQRRFAEAAEPPSLVHIPTGLGKTAMVVVGWLWRRRAASSGIKAATPRRLVYCLPMRVLVEQTRDNAVLWLHKLGLLGGKADFEEQDGKKHLGSYTPDFLDPRKVTVHVLMGGEGEDNWDIHPERDAILIGTQDMLLSRALNRGYAASRARWPMQFGLLHTDCLWVFDEIQLMGSGLATTAQLEAFRYLLGSQDGHDCRSVWMSATMQSGWLKTVDFDPASLGEPLQLDEDDFKNDEVKKRRKASKPLAKAQASIGDAAALAKEILDTHQPGTRTIVVVNTVKRACGLFNELNRSNGSPKLVLLHSRFRPGDRAKAVKAALTDPPPEGTIVVSTQVIEAGVDVSATILFTELAPWASLVQRFGRCNRRGEDSGAQVFWIDLPSNKAEDMARPYELAELRSARDQLQKLTDVGLKALPDVALPFEHTHVIRRKDLIDLFDTTPDLAGNDIDIDRFVREVEDSDVRVFWRTWDQNKTKAPPEDEPAPRREELCPAPIGSDKNPGFRQFAQKHRGKVWRWNFLERKWDKITKEEAARIAPGQVFLVHVEAGGYTPQRGWDAGEKKTVPPPPIDGWEPPKNASVPEQWTSFEQAIRACALDPDDYDDEALSRTDCWRKIADHTDDVCGELESTLDADAMPVRADERRALEHAARWHDRGKAHHVFQNAIDGGQSVKRRGEIIQRCQRPDEWKDCRVVAKAPGKRKETAGAVVDRGFWRRYDWHPTEGRKHFRHELASSLAVLLAPKSGEASIPDDLVSVPGSPSVPLRDLVAYLVASHHGKVRLSIRSLPNEMRPRDATGKPQPQKRFARGVWDGDTLAAADLGGGVTAPAATLSLEPMELGLCEQLPFVGQPSWAERMIRLRDTLGPFRLAYLEAILRAADMRASKAAEQREADNQHAGASAGRKGADHG